MGKPYTSGIWTVKPGRVDEFVAAWTDLAEWSMANVEGALPPQLLRDVGAPDRFVSFGPWANLEAIERWRAMEGWSERVGKIRELLSGFEAFTLEPVVDFH